MNASELMVFLKLHAVPAHYFTFGDTSDGEAVGLDFRDGRWITYGTERGKKIGIVAHASEAEAVESFLEDLRDLVATYERHPPNW